MPRFLEDKQASMREQFEGHRTISAANKHQRKSNRIAPTKPRKDYGWHDQAIILEASGTSRAAIARTLEKADSTIKRFLESNKSKERALVLFGGRSIEDIRKDLQDLAPLAILALKTLMESDDPAHTVAKADKALKILEAIGAKAPEETKVDHTHTHFDDFTKAIEDNARKQEKLGGNA